MNHNPLLEMPLSEIIDLMKLDPAAIMQFHAAVPAEFLGGRAIKKAGPPPMCPARTEITAIQTAIFDNWQDGSPNTGNQYGIAIEVWTDPEGDLCVTKSTYQFKCQAALLNARALKTYLGKLAKPRICPVDPSYLERLAAIQREMTPDVYIGLLNTRIARDDGEYERGTYYHADQYLMASITTNGVEEVLLVLGNEHVELAPFVTTNFKGGSLGRKVLCQSRLDLTGSLTEWATH